MSEAERDRVALIARLADVIDRAIPRLEQLAELTPAGPTRAAITAQIGEARAAVALARSR